MSSLSLTDPFMSTMLVDNYILTKAIRSPFDADREVPGIRVLSGAALVHLDDGSPISGPSCSWLEELEMAADMKKDGMGK